MMNQETAGDGRTGCLFIVGVVDEWIEQFKQSLALAWLNIDLGKQKVHLSFSLVLIV